METDYNHPLQKIIFIQRVAKFAASTPKKIIKLCYVTSEFRTSLISFAGFLQILFKPLITFPIHRFRQEEESGEASSTSLSPPLFGLSSSLKVSSRQELLRIVKECENEKIVKAIKHGELRHNLFGDAWKGMPEWRKFREIIFWCFSHISAENQEILDSVIDFVRFLRDEFWKENILHHILASSFFHYSVNRNAQNVDVYLSAIRNTKNPKFFEELSTRIFPLDIIHPRFSTVRSTKNSNNDNDDENNLICNNVLFRKVQKQFKQLLHTAANCGNAEALKFILDPAAKISSIFISAANSYVAHSGCTLGYFFQYLVYGPLKQIVTRRLNCHLDTVKIYLQNYLVDYSSFQQQQQQKKKKNTAATAIFFAPSIKVWGLTPAIWRTNVVNLLRSAVVHNDVEAVKYLTQLCENNDSPRRLVDIRSICSSPLDNRRYTYFLLAVQFGSVDVVRYVLEELFPINPETNSNNNNPFQNASTPLIASSSRTEGTLRSYHLYSNVITPFVRRQHERCRQGLRLFPKNNPFHILAQMRETKDRPSIKYGFVDFRIPSATAMRSKSEAQVAIANMIIDYCRKEEAVNECESSTKFWAFGAELRTLVNQENHLAMKCTPMQCCAHRKLPDLAQVLLDTGLVDG